MKSLFWIVCFMFQIINMSSKDYLIKTEEFFLKNTNYASLEEKIEKYKDQIAVSVVPLENNHTSFYFNKTGVFVSASMIKLLILCEFINQTDDNIISLDTN